MDIYGDYLQLARFAISGRSEDADALLRKVLRKVNKERPEFKEQLQRLLENNSTRSSSFLRKAPTATIRGGSNPESFLLTGTLTMDIEPVWVSGVEGPLQEIVSESARIQELIRAHVKPTRSVLFVGPPGVGKSLAASWLAMKLHRELKTLDLASIMSSYLGRTGTNLSKVVVEATSSDSILFLDEFDSIGKRRDDQGDVGELKRLVNVLLQSLDVSSPESLLIAATNHPDLLDPAVWRRFDRIIKFKLPTVMELLVYVERRQDSFHLSLTNNIQLLIASAMNGHSFSDVDNWMQSIIRGSILSGTTISEGFSNSAVDLLKEKPVSEKATVGALLYKEGGMSQRKVHDLLGISRDTIRKYAQMEDVSA